MRITLSKVKIAIQRTSDNKTNHAIRWRVIMLSDGWRYPPFEQPGHVLNWYYMGCLSLVVRYNASRVTVRFFFSFLELGDYIRAICIRPAFNFKNSFADI